jgi:hypothetical protein
LDLVTSKNEIRRFTELLIAAAADTVLVGDLK